MTENKKSAVFGGVVMAVVAIVLVLIIVFAVKGKSSGENTEPESESVTVSQTQSAPSQQESQTAQTTEKSADNNSAGSDKTTVKSDAGNSKSAEINAENERYKKQVARINDEYDKKVATERNAKELIEELSAQDIADYKAQINDLNARINSMPQSSQRDELCAERDFWQSKIDSIENECSNFDSNIEKHEKDRKNELADAKAEHEKKLAEISG